MEFGSVIERGKSRSLLDPTMELRLRQLELEDHSCVVCIRPSQATLQRGKVGQSENDVAEFSDGCDRPEPGPSLRDIVKISGVLPRSDLNAGAALNFISGMPTPPGSRPYVF